MIADTSVALKPCPPHADTPAKRLNWWVSLEPQWRAAFGIGFFGHGNPPDHDELVRLWQTPALRLVGPTAPYPNVNFELTNCSGVSELTNLEILVLTHHRLTSINEVASLPKLKSLFVNNNAIAQLDGVEKLTKLEQLYAHCNEIESLEPIRKLTNLRELYVNFNKLTSLEGLTPKHARAMKMLFALPSEHLTDRVVMREERRLGIRVRSV